MHNLTLLAVETLVVTYVETRSELQEHRGGQSLGEDVGKLLGCRGVEDVNISICRADAGRGWWRDRPC
jgi:hypothetical protein